MKLPPFPYPVWAGTESSLDHGRVAYEQLQADISAAVASGAYRVTDDEETVEVPYNFTMQGQVGVISIRGPLLNIDSWYARYRNATTYPDIRRALVYGVMHSGAKMLLLDIDSGGGAVAGVEDTGSLIRMINDTVMPVYAITGGTMASAAYWLGSSSGQVYVTKTSLGGSIGIISTHMEYSKALKEAGIGVTVVRSGQFKALASQVEPLSEQALKQMQDQLDATYVVFRDHVAAMRGVTAQVVEERMAQGRVFVGQDIVDAGLADGLMSFDRLVSVMNQRILDSEAQNAQQLPYSHERNYMSRTALTSQQIAALAAAKPAEVAAALAAAGLVTAPAPKPEDEQTEAAAETTTETKPAATPAAAPAAAAPAAPDQAQVVTYLQGQVTDLSGRVATLTGERDAAVAKHDEVKAQLPKLTAVVAGTVKTMRVALNMPAVDHAASTVDALMADYTQVLAAFETAFKSGGVAVPAAAASATGGGGAGKPALDPLVLARATRVQPLKK